MKRTFYLLKTLLVAVGLCVGANAWAQDTETVTILGPIDYSTTSMNWTVIGGTVSYSNGYAKHTQDGGGGNRSAYLDFGIAESIDDNWTVEFDASLKPGSDRNDQQIAVTGAKTTYTNNTSATGNMYFAVKEEANGGTTYTVKIGASDVATGVTLADGTTYHFIVTYDGSSNVTARIGDNQYVGTVAIADIGKLRGIHSCVARYNGATTFDNIIVTKEVEAGAVETPTAAITAVDGINRTVSFSCATDGVTFSYSTDGGSTFTEGSSLVISENTTIYVKATKGSKSATSDGLTFEAGTSITLKTPTWTKTGYTAGVSTVTLASDQSSLLLSPTATINYSINGGAYNTYSSPISVNDDDVLSYYASATGYTNSAIGSVTAVAPNTNAVLWSETYNGKVSSNINFSLGNDVVVTINDVDYKNIYYNEGVDLLSNNLLANNISTTSGGNTYYMMYRPNGLYAAAGWNLAISNLKAGDYLTINGVYGNAAFSITGNSTDLTEDEWNTIAGSTYGFTVKNNGTVRFSMARYGYIQNITVRRAIATPGATVGSTGFATFAADVDLDLSTLTDGFTAYFASAPAEGKVKMTKATNEKIAAGEGLFIEGSGAFTITETRDATDDVDNYLVAGDGVEDGIVKEDGFDKYVLGAYEESVAFFLINGTPATVPTNKAYLKVPNGGGSARLAIVFDDDATGISAVKGNAKVAESYYNLQGQRVNAPTKGLYIVNGKKTIIK